MQITMLNCGRLDHAYKHRKWSGTDTLKKYKEFNKNGANEFLIDEIDYIYNEDGFRCDSFTDTSELPIMVLGCSVTEGTGLHLENTWSKQLISKLRVETNKHIPYWSLASCGCGVDELARYFYWWSSKYKIAPKYVFMYLPQIHRREFCFENSTPTRWNFDYPNSLGPVFSDDYFAYYQSWRSLALIDSICKQHGSKLFCCSWDSSIHIQQVKNDFSHFHWVDTKLNYASLTDYARDSDHPGKKYHVALYQEFWDKLQREEFS